MTEPYNVRISARAARDLEKLPEKVAVACAEFVFTALAANPYRCGKPLEGTLAGHHSARRGTYRIIYTINDAEYSVEIEHIDHRGRVYRS